MVRAFDGHLILIFKAYIVLYNQTFRHPEYLILLVLSRVARVTQGTATLQIKQFGRQKTTVICITVTKWSQVTF